MGFWRRTARLAALLTMALVCVDLSLDGACDPISWSGAVSAGVVLSPLGGSSDGGALFCIPDCFCCSRSETAESVLPLPQLEVVAKAPSSSPAFVPAVVRPVLELPPVASLLS